MSLLFYIENFVVVGRTYPLIYTEEKEKGKTLFVEILLDSQWIHCCINL